MRARTTVWVGFALMFGAGCYAERVVGTSGEPSRAASKPRVPARIQPGPNENIGVDTPNLGDLDADGFDDFVIRSSPYAPPSRAEVPDQFRYYLYYGRREFPAQLSTADADAVLVGDFGYHIQALGDISGDGFADIAVMREGGVDFIYGSRERLHGVLDTSAVGVTWRHPELPHQALGEAPGHLMVGPAGDWNADGIDDLIVRATAPDAFEANSAGLASSEIGYLVFGARREWRPGVWDPALAAAEFNYEVIFPDDPDAPIEIDGAVPAGAGDTDGDGRDDLYSYRYRDGIAGVYVFYGGRTLESKVLVSQVDATLELPAAYEGLTLDDFDADGALDFLLRSSDGSGFGVVYGQRWSGEASLAPELTIDLDPLALYSTVMTGDIDGDGTAEILVASGRVFDTEGTLELAVYVVRGSEERLTGHIELDDSYLLAADTFPRPASKFAGLGGLGLVIAGDVDGDGGRDMLSSVVRTSDDPGGVTLIPSGPRPPQ